MESLDINPFLKLSVLSQRSKDQKFHFFRALIIAVADSLSLILFEPLEKNVFCANLLTVR